MTQAGMITFIYEAIHELNKEEAKPRSSEEQLEWIYQYFKKIRAQYSVTKGHGF